MLIRTSNFNLQPLKSPEIWCLPTSPSATGHESNACGTMPRKRRKEAKWSVLTSCPSIRTWRWIQCQLPKKTNPAICDTDADFAHMTAEESFSWRVLLRRGDIKLFRVHPYADSIAIQLSNKNAGRYILTPTKNPPGNDPITHLSPISGRNLKIHPLPHIRAVGCWCAGNMSIPIGSTYAIYTYIWFISMANLGTIRAHDCEVISMSRKWSHFRRRCSNGCRHTSWRTSK